MEKYSSKNSQTKETKMLKKLIIAIVIAVVIVIAVPLSISYYLSPQNALTKSDAIVVVSGGDTNARIAESVKVYFQKWAPLIIYSGAAASGDVSNALAMERIAISEGVPANAILIEQKSKTTIQNAEYVAPILKKNHITSIILITSPYHQRRAYDCFRSVLGKNFTIINHSAMDVNWSKKDWWDNATARFLTFGELLKNIYTIFVPAK